MGKTLIYRIGSLLAVYTFTTFIFIFSRGCDGIFPSQVKPTVPSDHNDNISGAFHKPDPKQADNCTECHGSDLKGGVVNIEGRLVFTNSCYQCHGKLWVNGGGGGNIK